MSMFLGLKTFHCEVPYVLVCAKPAICDHKPRRMNTRMTKLTQGRARQRDPEMRSWVSEWISAPPESHLLSSFRLLDWLLHTVSPPNTLAGKIYLPEVLQPLLGCLSSWPCPLESGDWETSLGHCAGWRAEYKRFWSQREHKRITRSNSCLRGNLRLC